MSIRLVDHINIATPEMEATKDFYVDVLGLTVGWRPPFAFPGYWLYAGDRAIVHMQVADRAVVGSADSALNHFAFDVDDLDALLARLDAAGVKYREVGVPGTQIRQAFLSDPAGVRVELNQRPGRRAD